MSEKKEVAFSALEVVEALAQAAIDSKRLDGGDHTYDVRFNKQRGDNDFVAILTQRGCDQNTD